MKTVSNHCLLTALLGLAALQPAQAIVVNSTFGAAGAIAYGSAFSSVVQLNYNNNQRCTGAVISATAILTAQHCTAGLSAGLFSVGFDQNGDGSFDQWNGVTSKFEVPGYLGTSQSRNGTDMAILTIGGALPSWATPFELFAGDPFAELVTMVGFGRRGVESVSGASPSGVRWAADNIVDAVGAVPGYGGSNMISTDFDNGTPGANTLSSVGSSATPLAREGTTAQGDSGGPLLFKRGNNYLIGGVLTGGSRGDSGYGDISWWTGTSMYRTDIERFGGVFYTAPTNNGVPEPGSLALALLALAAMVGLGARPRAR